MNDELQDAITRAIHIAEEVEYNQDTTLSSQEAITAYENVGRIVCHCIAVYGLQVVAQYRQQAPGECPLCGRSKDICDGNCTCPECKGNGFDGYCMDCKVCDGTGIIIAKQPQPDSE